MSTDVARMGSGDDGEENISGVEMVNTVGNNTNHENEVDVDIKTGAVAAAVAAALVATLAESEDTTVDPEEARTTNPANVDSHA